ncbi:hypothetical protein HMPREF1992_01785 [Selenomonas sp. oral taxon 892 str. F0426]|nr:hypothetical protein HMPREF1992_01785 [Selenomonas sp. oral taxon 892 str. F0426]
MKNGIQNKIESYFLISFTTLGKIILCKNPVRGVLSTGTGFRSTKEQ